MSIPNVGRAILESRTAWNLVLMLAALSIWRSGVGSEPRPRRPAVELSSQSRSTMLASYVRKQPRNTRHYDKCVFK